MQDDAIARAKQQQCADYLANRGWSGRRKGGWIVGPCPVCGQGDDRFYINPNSNIWGLRSCSHGTRPPSKNGDIGGDIIDLVEMIENVGRPDALQRLVGPVRGSGRRNAANLPVPAGKGNRPALKSSGSAANGSSGLGRPGSGGGKASNGHDGRQLDWRHGIPFEYHNADGSVPYRMLRVPVVGPDGHPWMTGGKGGKPAKPDKEFIRQVPDPTNRWGWRAARAGEVPGIIYNLHRVSQAVTAETGVDIFVVEGEAKADLLTSWGYLATSVPRDAGANGDDWGRWFADANVVIVPDHDAAGAKYAVWVANVVRRHAASIELLELPGLKEAEDVINWARGGGTREAFDALVDLAKPFDPPPPPPDEPPPPKPEPDPDDEPDRGGFSDDALALRLLDTHAANLRYVEMWKRWLVWDEVRWRKEETLAMFDISRGFLRAVSQEADDWRTQKAIRGHKTVAAIENMSRSDRRVALRTDDLDSHIWLLNTPGGTVDLKTGLMRPHDRKDHITKTTSVAPSEEDHCPMWCEFLNKVMGGNGELVAFLQRMVGYALTGSVKEEALFFLYGTGGNGKGVFVNTLGDILGDYRGTAPMDAFMEEQGARHPTELAGLVGARFVTASETDEGRRWSESKIKMLTGGDMVPARFMRQDFFSYLPQFKLIISGNNKPALRTVDEAIRRRFHMIPFAVTIPEGERDLELKSKLKAEHAGILRWAIDGCLAWQQQGLAPPLGVREATAEYLQTEDIIASWIADCCVEDPSAWKSSTDLYNSWSAWATKNGEFPGGIKRFSQKLDNRPGLTKKRLPQGSGFEGLRFKVLY